MAGVGWIHANGWVPVPSPLPRARLVSQVVVSVNEPTALAAIDPVTTAIVERPIGTLVGPPGTVNVKVNRPGWVEIDTDAPGRQFLVWAERYDSGWNATIDGKPVPVLRAYGDFMGCPVGPGKQHVVLRFEPASFAGAANYARRALCDFRAGGCVVRACRRTAAASLGGVVDGRRRGACLTARRGSINRDRS